MAILTDNNTWNYGLSDQVQYSVMASRTSNQAWSKGLYQVHTVNSNSRNSKANIAYFQKKNPIIRIFGISWWLAVPINPGKWSCTVILIRCPGHLPISRQPSGKASEAAGLSRFYFFQQSYFSRGKVIYCFWSTALCHWTVGSWRLEAK